MLVSLFVCLSVLTAYGQQIDAAFGVSTVSSTSGASASGNYFPQNVGGGAFPGFSADFLLFHHLGAEGEVFWRAGQNSYAGSQPFRPIFIAFNAIWVQPIVSRLAIEALAGLGAESVRFYQPFLNVNFTNYTSQNHFMGDVGGGVRLYVTPHVFIRPEVRLYLVHDNFQFSSGHATRLGASLGYSFGK